MFVDTVVLEFVKIKKGVFLKQFNANIMGGHII